MLTDMYFVLVGIPFVILFIALWIAIVHATTGEQENLYGWGLVVSGTIGVVCFFGWLIAFIDQNQNRIDKKWTDARERVRRTCYPYVYENRAKVKNAYQFTCANDKSIRVVRIK